MNTMAQEADEAIAKAFSTVMRRNTLAVANIYIFPLWSNVAFVVVKVCVALWSYLQDSLGG